MKTWTHPERKDTMPPGPWQHEPDKAQWVDNTGLDCLIVRNRMNALCGYVGVPPDHPLHGLDYEDCPDVDVHGGLTFAAACDEHATEGHGICHVPEPGRPGDVWWLGFDCAHGCDAKPDKRMPAFDWETYRDFNYVATEVSRLAAQLADVIRAGRRDGNEEQP